MTVIARGEYTIEIYSPEVMRLGDPLWPHNRFAIYTRGPCKGELFVVETAVSQDFVEDTAIDFPGWAIQNFEEMCSHSTPPGGELFTNSTYKNATPNRLMVLLHYLHQHISVQSFVCTKLESRILLNIVTTMKKGDKTLHITRAYSLATLVDSNAGIEPFLRDLEHTIEKAITET